MNKPTKKRKQEEEQNDGTRIGLHGEGEMRGKKKMQGNVANERERER